MALKPNTAFVLSWGGTTPFVRPNHILFFIGGSVLAGSIALALLAPAFAYGLPLSNHPITGLILLYSAMGLLTSPLFILVPKLQETQRLFYGAMAIGLVARLLFLPTTPIYEDDFYRYLWDGAVTAHGIDPYKYPPSDFIPKDDALASILGPPSTVSSDDAGALSELAKEAGPVIERVNYPYIKTNYPPVAQAAFAVAYTLEPWSLIVWRLICLACELLALFFVIRSLDALNRSRMWSLIYWWNPIAIMEIANRAHMDALLVPALAATVFFTITRRPIVATAALSAAVGIKFWPALLFPVLFRDQTGDWRTLIAMGLVATILCGLFLFPQLPNGLDPNSGLVTYSQSWQTNSFAFSQIEWLFGQIGVGDADLATRFFVFGVVSLSAVAIAMPKPQDVTTVIGRMLFVVTALFLLSPTQYPWYFLWMLPFLVFVPVWPLLAIPITLPLYFSRYYFIDTQYEDFFNSVVVPLEFGPIFLALAFWLWYRHPQTRKRANAE